MAADINVAGLVFGTIFGTLFLLTCLISAVKAVKDRRRIKERIENKRRQRLEYSAYDNIQNDICQYPDINGTPDTLVKLKTEHLQNAYVQNHVPRTFSSEGIPGEKRTLKQTYSSPVGSMPNVYPSVRISDPNLLTTISNDSIVASRNLLRRMSYDVAVGSYSWLNRDPPTYASSSTISNMYTHLEPGPVVVFENKAFDCENQI